MTLYAPSQGTRMVKGVNLDSTDPVTLAIVREEQKAKRVTLESVHIACAGTSTAFSLWWEDGKGNNIYLLNASVISANNLFQVKDIHIPLTPGQALKCNAGAADFISVTAVFFEHAPQSTKVA